ncbi:MAG: HAD family phosphatase [Patescibacteria group bacterium]|jgi:HAD superfamily hydrolase (TIGR01490 family)
MKKVAIFDIDGSIFRSSLVIEITNALVDEGYFPKSTKKFYHQALEKWLNRQDSYEKYINAVVQAFGKNIKGVRQKDFSDLARRIISRDKNRVYRFSRDLVKQLKKKNYYLLAISHSPKEIVQEFAHSFGFDKAYGRILETNKQGIFTGRVLYADLIDDKAKILKRAVSHNNLTLRGSVGVGDTESDIPFLRLVSKPICFNPNKKLYTRAKKAGWEIVLERKDVIYKI